MIKKSLSALLAAVFLLVLVVPASPRASASETEEEVYTFLTEELGLNSAAAVGIMANIMCECSFDPNAGGIDTNFLYSYGLVMWNGPRFEMLKYWCGQNELDYTTVSGQLAFLKYELENGERDTLDAMLGVSDTFEGAVEAAVLFADLFERCAYFSYGLRVYYTTNMFWPEFGNGKESEIRGIYAHFCNYPAKLKEGESFSLKGAVVSYNTPIKEITVGIYDGSGNLISGTTAEPDSYCFNITAADPYVIFNILEEGTYFYRISAENADGIYKVLEYEFTVGEEKTEGKYSRFDEGEVLCGYGLYCPGAKFSDMPPVGSWAHEGIDYVISSELFLGVSKKKFGVDDPMTRAMLVTVLWRIEGTPSVETDEETAAVQFEDVDPEIWYTEAVSWAHSRGIVKGVSEVYFDPDACVTREQVAAIVHRYAASKGLDFSNRSDISGFPDAEDVSPWATDDMEWALNTGLITGSKVYGVNMLNPKGDATRAQVALILMRFVEEILI